MSYTDEEQALLQSRSARLGLLFGAMSGIMLAYRVASMLGRFSTEVEFNRPGGMIAHALATVVFLGLWLGCRGRAMAPRTVHGVTALALVGGSVCLLAMNWFAPLWSRPENWLLLINAMLLLVRSVWVPSSARHTALLGSMLGVPFLVGVYLRYAYHYQPELYAPSIALHHMRPREIGAAITFGMASWWIIIVIACATTSRVIHGLRQQMHDIRKIGQYTLESKLGEGGMGIVFRAHHAMLRRPTAVKLLPRSKTGDAAIAFFEREVRLCATLSHPNIVTIFDYGRTPDGTFYYAMELLDGASVEAIVERTGAQSPARTIHVLCDVAAALTEAHDHGIIHRDIKPANIVLCRYGGQSDVAKVVDFGLVKLADESSSASPGAGSERAIIGTPAYISPEACTAPETVGPRSDIYALGAVGYYLLTGRHVFVGATVAEVISQHLQATPEPPSRHTDAAIPEALEALILQCLSKRPDDRPKSARELLAQLSVMKRAADWRPDPWWANFGHLLGREPAADAELGLQMTVQIELADRGVAAAAPAIRTGTRSRR